jgi:hypothetical protein
VATSPLLESVRDEGLKHLPVLGVIVNMCTVAGKYKYSKKDIRKVICRSIVFAGNHSAFSPNLLLLSN